MKRSSVFYNFLRKIDVFVYVNRGLIPDLKRLDFVREERQLFSDEGLLRISMSIIPGTDGRLKATVKALGGWQVLMQPSFIVTEEVYSKLERSGLGREQFDKSRAYIANPSRYGK